MGLLREEILGELPFEDISWYSSTGLYARQALSARVERELPFSYAVAAKELYSNSSSDETVLLQGVIDCCFLENGGWVLVDYKTDRPRKDRTVQEMAEEHRMQLKLYADALQRLSGIPVLEMHVVMLSMHQCVNFPLV